MKKKVFFLIIVIAAIININNYSYGADKTDNVSEIIVVNPNYSSVLTEQKVKNMINNDIEQKDKNLLTYKANTLNSKYKGNYYYNSKKDAANYVKNKMKNRINQVTVRYETTESDYQNVATSIVKKAISEELAKYSDEGDYLAWSYGGYKVSGGYYHSGNKYYWVLNYTFTYYTTYEQEKILDGRIKSFLNKIDVKKESQYSLIKQINDYICSNVEYDYSHLYDKSYKPQFTAYAALIKGKAVCQGYATLYYRMLKECGIDNRIIVSTTHAWNIVKIGKLYYNVDGVWNDGAKNDMYFLSGSTDFVKDFDHIRNKEYTTASFNKKYPISNNKFKIEIKQVNSLKVSKTTKNTITLNWNAQDNITGYRIYKYNYNKNSWEYYKQVKGSKNNGCKVKNLSEGKAYKFRVRGYVAVNSQKVYGQYSTSLKTITSPNSTSIKSINVKNKNQIIVKWKKVFSSNAYQLQIATNSKFSKNLQTFTIKDKYSNSKKIKNLKKGKKYYVRVRAYKKYSGKKYYSSWSEIKTIKCK